MWVELVTQDDKGAAAGRLLINMDALFAFQENSDGTCNAISITGIGVPIALPYETARTEIMEEQ